MNAEPSGTVELIDAFTLSPVHDFTPFPLPLGAFLQGLVANEDAAAVLGRFAAFPSSAEFTSRLLALPEMEAVRSAMESPAEDITHAYRLTIDMSVLMAWFVAHAPLAAATVADDEESLVTLSTHPDPEVRTAATERLVHLLHTPAHP